MKHFYILLFILLFTHCKKTDTVQNSIQKETLSLLSQAKEISIAKEKDVYTITSGGQTTRFQANELPLKTVMLIPTSGIAYLDALGLLDVIKGVSEANYIYNPKIAEKIKDKSILEIGTYNELYLELIFAQKPDVFISVSNPVLAKFHEQLKNNGVKIIYIDEYKEAHPLAKSEYIKIFGLLFNKEKEASLLYKEIEDNYISIQKIIENDSVYKPEVFVNGMYGDVWYMSGGNSFQATYLKDSGASYIWKDDESTSTLNLSFEEVYEKAKKAKYWVNVGDFPTQKALLSSYSKYAWFDAVKTKNVYNWGKRSNAKGANDYFETGIVRSDWILKDLASIFHPDLFPNQKLYFYQKLE